jgi:hypothetical protein
MGCGAARSTLQRLYGPHNVHLGHLEYAAHDTGAERCARPADVGLRRKFCRDIAQARVRVFALIVLGSGHNAWVTFHGLHP